MTDLTASLDLTASPDLTTSTEPAAQPTTAPTATWDAVLDSLAAHVELQEQALRFGSPAPVDLEIDPPDAALSDLQRQRAIALFDRCEELLDLAAARAVDTRGRLTPSPYRTP